jgi:hypothetical protein
MSFGVVAKDFERRAHQSHDAVRVMTGAAARDRLAVLVESLEGVARAEATARE